MTPVPTPFAFAAFKVGPFSFTDAEMRDYERLMRRRQRRSLGWPASRRYGWLNVVGGFVLALLGGFLAVAFGVPAQKGAVVATLVLAGWWAGLYSSFLFGALALRASRRAGWLELQSRSKDATIVISPAGVVTRTAGTRTFYARTSFTGSTHAGDFVTLWRGSTAIVTLPTRALTPTQQHAFLSLGAATRDL